MNGTDRISRLVEWAETVLVNRADVWGGYANCGALTLPAVRDRGKVFLDRRVLHDHFTGHRSIGIHAISRTNSAKWCGWDVDAHSDEADPDANWRIVESIVDQLITLGIEPIVEDSNGRGGYHVWALWATAIPSSIAYRFAKWIKGRAGSPEIEGFPKQPDIGSHRPCGNWLRVPGKHHKREHWSRIYDLESETWLARNDAIDALLAATLNDPDLIDDVLPLLPPVEPPREAVRLNVVAGADDPACVRDLLRTSIRKAGDRNRALLSLSRYWKAAGRSQDEAIALGIEFTRRIPPALTTADLTDAEIAANVASVVAAVFNGSYQFGCEYMLSHGVPGNRIACDRGQCAFIEHDDSAVPADTIEEFREVDLVCVA